MVIVPGAGRCLVPGGPRRMSRLLPVADATYILIIGRARKVWDLTGPVPYARREPGSLTAVQRLTSRSRLNLDSPLVSIRPLAYDLAGR
jgi:hypothetical protein